MFAQSVRPSCIRAPGPLVKAGKTQEGRKVTLPPLCHIIGVAAPQAAILRPFRYCSFPANTGRGIFPLSPHVRAEKEGV